MYAYCGNNPVMSYDPQGNWDLWGALKSVGQAIVVAAVVVTAAVVIATTVTVAAVASVSSGGTAAIATVPAATAIVTTTLEICTAATVAGVTAIAAGEIGENIYFEKEKRPYTGEPNSTWAGSNGDKRTFGDDGKPKQDYDHDDHGNPKHHPHDEKGGHYHDWSNGKRGPAHLRNVSCRNTIMIL